MLKVEIVFDEENIVAEDKYDIEKMYAVIDEAFAQYGIRKETKGVYVGGEKGSDFAHMWKVNLQLTKEKWFMDNAVKWLWYNSDNGIDENDFSVEDVLAYYRAKQSKGA